MQHIQIIKLASGPVFGLLTFLLCHWADQPQVIALTAAITALTAVWWITEALPIPVTSLVPFALFPLADVISHKTAASALGSHVILLLMGAFMLSKSVEKSGVHRRIALSMINLLGAQNPKRLVLGFMLTAALLSMWISNTATTLMLLPIALAVIGGSKDTKLATVLLLGIAFAANLGGIGTPIGTPPNIIFVGAYQDAFGVEFGFLDWMMIGVPVVLIGVPLMAIWLTRGLKQCEKLDIPKVGQWQVAEKRVLLVFGLTALAWIFRKEPFGGWTGAFDLTSVGDSTIALAAVVVMFLVSNGKKEADGKTGRLLDWPTAVSIPWGMLLLFAGGICIAKAFQASGLSQLLGDNLSSLSGFPTFLMILFICLSVTFLTEITSNTATATLLMPILAVAGASAGVDATLLMIPAAMSASCAFMLPVATAPNAIVYSSDKFSIQTMAKEGFVLNIIMAFLIASLCYFLLG